MKYLEFAIGNIPSTELVLVAPWDSLRSCDKPKPPGGGGELVAYCTDRGATLGKLHWFQQKIDLEKVRGPLPTGPVHPARMSIYHASCRWRNVLSLMTQNRSSQFSLHPATRRETMVSFFLFPEIPEPPAYVGAESSSDLDPPCD